MTEQQFLRGFKQQGLGINNDEYILSRVKKKHGKHGARLIYVGDEEHGKYGDDVIFETLEEAYAYKIGDETIKEIIERTTEEEFYMVTLDGGRGASSGGKKTSNSETIPM